MAGVDWLGNGTWLTSVEVEAGGSVTLQVPPPAPGNSTGPGATVTWQLSEPGAGPGRGDNAPGTTGPSPAAMGMRGWIGAGADPGGRRAHSTVHLPRGHAMLVPVTVHADRGLLSALLYGVGPGLAPWRLHALPTGAANAGAPMPCAQGPWILWQGDGQHEESGGPSSWPQSVLARPRSMALWKLAPIARHPQARADDAGVWAAVVAHPACPVTLRHEGLECRGRSAGPTPEAGHCSRQPPRCDHPRR